MRKVISEQLDFHMDEQIETAIYLRDVNQILPSSLESWLSADDVLKLAGNASALHQWDDDLRIQSTLKTKTAALASCYALGDRTIAEVSARILTTPELLILWGEPVEAVRVRIFQAHHEPAVGMVLSVILVGAWKAHRRANKTASSLPLNWMQLQSCLLAIAQRRVRQSF